jgi:hypothetical protein
MRTVADLEIEIAYANKALVDLHVELRQAYKNRNAAILADHDAGLKRMEIANKHSTSRAAIDQIIWKAGKAKPQAARTSVYKERVGAFLRRGYSPHVARVKARSGVPT